MVLGALALVRRGGAQAFGYGPEVIHLIFDNKDH